MCVSVCVSVCVVVSGLGHRLAGLQHMVGVIIDHAVELVGRLQ